jgi:septal ring factor EnvC (AmiA/AmiB activator)
MSRGVRRLGAALVAIALLASHDPAVPRRAGAQTEDSAAAARRRAEEQRLEEQKRRELETVQRQAREKREAAVRLRGQESKALTQLRRTERDLGTTRRRLRNLNQHQRRLDQQLEVTEATLERSVLTLEQQRRLLARRLRHLYMYSGPGRELEFLLSTHSFAQLLARWDYVVMVAEQDRVMLEDYRERLTDVESQKSKLESNLAEIQRNAQRTAIQNRRLASLRQERARTVSEIQSQREAYEAAAAELERTARAIRSLLAELERKRAAEAARAKAEGRAPQPYTGDFARGQGSLDWPVRGTVVGRFGQEKHPKYNVYTVNNGIDIAVAVGTPVRAVARGRVDYTSEDYGSFGPIVIVNHGDGYYTLYGHLSEIHVSVGQEVAAGAAIGRSGEEGSLKGPMLHFEVRKGASALDPADWLR